MGYVGIIKCLNTYKLIRKLRQEICRSQSEHSGAYVTTHKSGYLRDCVSKAGNFINGKSSLIDSLHVVQIGIIDPASCKSYFQPRPAHHSLSIWLSL